MQPVDLIVEREHLPEALHAFLRHDKAAYDDCVKALRRDLLSEHRAGVEEKIARWIEVTRIARACNTRLVQFYMQAKLLYRDGYFEAAIMMCRSAAELICHELLQTVEHPFGDADHAAHVEQRLARLIANGRASIWRRGQDRARELSQAGALLAQTHQRAEQASLRTIERSVHHRQQLRAPPKGNSRRVGTRSPTCCNSANASTGCMPCRKRRKPNQRQRSPRQEHGASGRVRSQWPVRLLPKPRRISD